MNNHNPPFRPQNNKPIKWATQTGWTISSTLITKCALTQVKLHRLRHRLGEPYRKWDVKHLANAVFRGLERDIRVVRDTIVVTYYNAPNKDVLSRQYKDLPDRLERENVDPHIPWLYGFKLDFRFK